MRPARVDARWQAALAAVGAALLASGCTVLPIEEARALRARDSGAFDTAAYIAGIWPAKAQAELRGRAVPLETLAESGAALGERHGHRAGDGSPWTFAVQGEGVVREVLRDDPRGRIRLDTPSGPVTLQVGPVVPGTAIRDAMPSIGFDAFPDQISFAEVGMALTDRALASLRQPIAALRPGRRVRFLGAASLVDGASELEVTPVELAVLPAGDAGAAR